MTPLRRRRLTVFVSCCVAAAIVVIGLIFAISRGGGDVPDAEGPVPVPPRADAPARQESETSSLEGHASLVDERWAAEVSERTGIPVRALQSYAGVAIAKQRENPQCNVGWNTLAAVGNTESSHGTHGGSSVAQDGSVSPPIVGMALDGERFESIPDSDGGRIDGDAEWDRAVGPMQFIPESWRNWGTDASGDGVADVHNLDDATLATANYLCRAGGDLSVDDQWRAAIAAYNSDPAYSRSVSAAAIRYAEQAG